MATHLSDQRFVFCEAGHESWKVKVQHQMSNVQDKPVHKGHVLQFRLVPAMEMFRSPSFDFL